MRKTKMQRATELYEKGKRTMRRAEAQLAQALKLKREAQEEYFKQEGGCI